MSTTPDCGGPDRCVNDMCRGYDEGICGRLSDLALAFAIYDDETESVDVPWEIHRAGGTQNG